LDLLTGRVAPEGDINGLTEAILNLSGKGQLVMRQPCRRRAEPMFDDADRFAEYLDQVEAVRDYEVQRASLRTTMET
jgi:hypothetical protein